MAETPGPVAAGTGPRHVALAFPIKFIVTGGMLLAAGTIEAMARHGWKAAESA